jgi:hypothetical protein
LFLIYDRQTLLAKETIRSYVTSGKFDILERNETKRKVAKQVDEQRTREKERSNRYGELKNNAHWDILVIMMIICLKIHRNAEEAGAKKSIQLCEKNRECHLVVMKSCYGHY